MPYDEEQKYGAAQDNPQVGQWGTWVSAEYKTDILGYRWRRIGRTARPIDWKFVVIILMTIPGFWFLYKMFYDMVHLK